MIRSVYLDWIDRDDPYHDVVPNIQEHMQDIDFKAAWPIVKWGSTKIIGRFIPAIGALSIAKDIHSVVTRLHTRYPGAGQQLYEDVMDAQRFYRGNRNLDEYYSDKWVKDSHW